MQIITSLQRILQLLRIRLVPQHPIKINHRIKDSTLSNKFINPLSRLLSFRITVTFYRRIPPRGTERRDGSSKDSDFSGLESDNHLLESSDETITDYFLRGSVGVSGSDVVHAFKDHGVSDAAVGEYVSVDSAEGVRAQAIVENAVPARSLVDNCDGGGVVVGLHAGENEVRPSVVLVIVAAAAVSDAITYYGEGAVVLGGVDFNYGEEVPITSQLLVLTDVQEKGIGKRVVPVLYAYSVGIGNVSCIDLVSEGYPTCRPTSRVRSYEICCLSIL